MSEKTHIEWASHTASPWFGCSKVSPGCTNCYAEKLTLQKGWAGWGDNSPRVRSKGFWKDAYRLNRQAGLKQQLHAARIDKAKLDLQPRMFTSLMDWLDPKAPIEWLADFLKVVQECKNLDWLLLTKRPELWRDRMSSVIGYWARGQGGGDTADWLLDWRNGNPPANVWFGVTVENQEMFSERAPVLMSIPAKIRWLSVEPLLSPVSFDVYEKGVERKFPSNIHWVVVGGESGSKRRDCGTVAIAHVVAQCQDAEVPVFVKQDCHQKPGQQGRIHDDLWALKQFPK